MTREEQIKEALDKINTICKEAEIALEVGHQINIRDLKPKEEVKDNGSDTAKESGQTDSSNA